MAIQYSIQKMVSDGTLSTIALGIQYLQRNDIYMRVAGEETPQSGAPSGYTWSFLDNTTLKILPVVPNGVEVVVYRRTDVDAMYNVYSQNAQFDEATIDENNQQLLYIAQEYLEQGLPGAGVDTIEFLRDDGTTTYYRIKRTDGSYSEEFQVPSAGSITKILARESLRRSYAEAGYNLVDGSFDAGGALVSSNDVLLQESTGKAFSGPAGTVPAGSTPSSAWIDRSTAPNAFKLSDVAGVLRPSQNKMADIVSLMDFGAKGDNVSDDTSAMVAMASWVNSRPKYSTPVSIIIPNGIYKYTGGLDFIRPVAIYGQQGATLNYTGAGKALAIGDPSPENAPTADNFYQGEYTIEGLRFTGGASATHGIFIKSFVFTPRIRNCLFVDFGNPTSYDIFSQYEDWDGLIECCEKKTIDSATATGNFIAILGKKTDGSAYDGGNSRFTIRDCSMTSCNGQQLGYFAYLNSVKCRVIGGNAHHSSGGILIGPNAHGTLIDGYYTEVSTTTRPWMVSVASDTSNPSNYFTPQGVIIKNCYINMHSEVIGSAGKIIGMMDAGVKLRNWVVEDVSVSTFADGQLLIDMVNISEQIGNVYTRVVPVTSPYNAAPGVKFTVVNNPSLSPNAWTSGDVEEGVWTPTVGGTATYFSQIGRYRKEGNKVTAEFDIHINQLGTGAQAEIGGLPIQNGTNSGAGFVGYYSNLATAVYVPVLRVDALSSSVTLSASTASAVGISGTVNLMGNNSRLIGSVTYFIK